MYKVFIENKAIIIKKGFEPIPILFSEYGPSLKTSRFRKFSIELSYLSENLTITCDDPKKVFQTFFKNFKLIEAAGGIVRSSDSPLRYLFIKRWGKWDIPKGKLEKGETPPRGAIREIEEECNMKEIELISELSPTYHVYFMYNKFVLKKTHWYLFEGNSAQQLIPQLQEDITEVKWFEKKEFSLIKANTYTSLLELITEVEMNH
jgi:8-oxo-dGTP pyrophosphatase MutT (NUDIX family)